MTKRETSIYAKNFEARRSSRITHLTSGHIAQFGDGVRAQRELSADSPGSGWLAKEDNIADDPNWRDDITSSISYIQRAIDKLGKDNPGINRALASLLATANVLVQSSDSTVERAGINIGSAQNPVVTKSNEASKTGGKAVIDIAQWAKDCPAILRLAKKHPEAFSAANE